MSIKIVQEVHHHEGGPDISAPRFFCDHCDRPIEDANLGLYVFPAADLENEDYMEGRKAVPLFTVHKGRCDEQFHLDRGHDPDNVPTGELSVLLVYLGNNMGLDWDQAWGMVE